jgi:hypothetical protein
MPTGNFFIHNTLKKILLYACKLYLSIDIMPNKNINLAWIVCDDWHELKVCVYQPIFDMQATFFDE